VKRWAIPLGVAAIVAAGRFLVPRVMGNVGEMLALMVYELVEQGELDQAEQVERLLLNPLQRFRGLHVSDYARESRAKREP
jgi:hypothetical protein